MKIQHGYRVKTKLVRLFLFLAFSTLFNSTFCIPPIHHLRVDFFSLLIFANILSSGCTLFLCPHPNEVLTPAMEAARVVLFAPFMGLSFLRIQFIKVLHLWFFCSCYGKYGFNCVCVVLFLTIGVRMFHIVLYLSWGLEQNDIVFLQILITSLTFHEVEPDAKLLPWPLALPVVSSERILCGFQGFLHNFRLN